MKIGILLAAILMLLALPGCAGDDDAASRAAATETATPGATTGAAPPSPTLESTSALAPPVQPAPLATAVAPLAPQPTAVPGPPRATVSNPNGVCIEAWTPGEIIENLLIGPCGDIGIDIRAANVTVRNVTIFNAGTSLRVYEASGAVIENNTLRDPTGLGAGGYVQQISLDKASNIRITGNVLTCAGAATCGQEDAIGIFESSNVIVEGNSISGGNSDSGCGILADDGAQRVTIRGNTIRNQMNCGIGIANGTNHQVEGNDIATYGNVGIYVWNQYGGQCSRITVRNNVVAGSNPWWNGDNCSQVQVTSNSFEEE